MKCGGGSTCRHCVEVQVPVGTVEPEEHNECCHQDAPGVPVVLGEGAEGRVGGGVGAQGGQGVVVRPQLLVVPRPT